MRTVFDCIPCFMRQALDSVRRLTDREDVQEEVLRGVLRAAGEMDLRQSPPAMGQVIHRLIREATGNPDPYREVKARLNRLALDLYPAFHRKAGEAADPFGAALRLAAAANVIDLGVKSGIDESRLAEEIEASLEAPLDGAASERLRRAAGEAGDILIIGDNAGEIVFDRLLVERFGPAKVTYAVRGRPVINDATREDAEACGLAGLVKIVDSGSDAPGTILEDCGPEFRERFAGADLILAKGQGNFETLGGAAGPLFFLLKVKCPTVAGHLGSPVGSLVLAEGNGRRPPAGAGGN
jgi:hypothetical protein